LQQRPVYLASALKVTHTQHNRHPPLHFIRHVYIHTPADTQGANCYLSQIGSSRDFQRESFLKILPFAKSGELVPAKLIEAIKSDDYLWRAICFIQINIYFEFLCAFISPTKKGMKKH